MKKLTAGILASLIGLVSANSAEAAVASTSYVDGAIGTKQDTLTPTNFKVGANQTGEYVTGFTVNNGVVEFTKGTPEKATVDAALSDTSENAVQNKVIKAALDLKQDTLKEANAGAGIKIANGVISADVTTDILNTELAKKQNTLNWGTNLTYDSTTNTVSATDTTYTTGTATAEGLTKLYTTTGAETDGTMTQAAITTELGKKQNTLTQATNAGDGITIDDTTGKISADITQTEFDTALGNKQNKLTAGANIQIAEDGTISATDTTYTTGTDATSGLTKLYTTTGAATDGTMTQAAITTELGNKQGNLTAGNGITLDAAGNIAAKAGTGITIDANGINANNQLDGVTDEAEDGLQVLTRKNCVNGVCEYVWETIDRVYGD